MSINRRELLAGGAAGLLVGAARAATPPQTTSLLVVYANGGWDTSYTVDPKLGSPYVEGPDHDAADPGDPDDVEVELSWGGIRAATNEAKRPNIKAFFDRWASRSLVINGIEAGGIAHIPNRRRVLAGTSVAANPDLLSIVASESDPLLPFGAVDLSGWCAPGPFAGHVGRLGYRWQLGAMLDPTTGQLGFGLAADPAGDALIAKHLRGRVEALQAGGANAWLANYDLASTRLESLKARSTELAALLAAGPEVSLTLVGNLDLAAKLVVGGWCRGVMVDSQQYFDTHDTNPDQHARNNELFGGLSALLDQLDAAGVLDRTLVVVTSEMTRSPSRNAGNGKDHWPVLSYLLLGGGVSGGRTVGATDDYTLPMPLDIASGEPDPDGEICRYNHVAAGILKFLELDPEPWLPGITPLGGIG